MSQQHPPTLTLIRADEVRRRCGGISRMQLWRLEQSGRFPQRVQLGPNSVAWLAHEVDAWIEARARARTTKPSAAA